MDTATLLNVPHDPCHPRGARTEAARGATAAAAGGGAALGPRPAQPAAVHLEKAWLGIELGDSGPWDAREIVVISGILGKDFVEIATDQGEKKG